MARLDVSLLGAFAVTLDSQPVTSFESNKVRALLAFLAAEQSRPHGRERVAELLWPNQPAGAALGNLRHVLANLRRVLDDHLATPPYLLITADTLQFNPAADAVVDLTRFVALTSVRAASSPTLAAYREALVLYRGPFLQGFTLDDSPDFGEWVAVVREQADRHLVQTLVRLADYSIEQGDYAQAVELTRRQVDLEPWNEEAHCQLMALLAVCGQRSAALHQFALCKRLLAAELGVEPQPETLALVEQIRLGRVERTALRRAPLIRQPFSLSHPLAHNLPAQHTPFFGRRAELARIAVSLDDPNCRLLTLVGPGGVGKTRLAAEAATRHVVSFTQGIWFVALTAVQGEAWVSAILQALQVPAQGASEPWQQLLDFLEDKELLLVLDNFEHLVDQAGLIAQLLAAAPRIKLLVTSRVRLNISPEWLFPLEGLDLPPLSAQTPPALGTPIAPPAVQEWLQGEGYSALQLFLHGIRRLQPDFAPTPDDAALAVRICRLLGGIPLALELAATWVRILGLPAVLARLEQRLDVPATTLRDVPERHRSMRAVFDHSWQLLAAREQCLLRQMAVFQGGFTASAAEAVTDALPADLAGLVDKSWLRVLPSGRYEMHELVRQYAEARLLEAQAAPGGEAGGNVRDRHCAHFAGLLRARAGGINLHHAVMTDILSDYANFLAAWQWAVDQGESAIAVDMVLAFYFAGDMLGSFRFTLHSFEGAIRALATYGDKAAPPRKPRPEAGHLLCWLYYTRTWHLIYLGLLEQAQVENERNLAVQTRMAAGDPRTEQRLLTDWVSAWLAYYRGHFAEARRSFRSLLRRFRTTKLDYTLYGPVTGALFWQAHSEAALAMLAWVAGHYHVAQQRLHRALALRDQIGEQRYRAFNLGLRARICLTTGEYAQAEAATRTGLRLSATFDDQIGMAVGHLALGRVEAAVGHCAQARVHFQHSEAAGRESGYHRLLMESLTELGNLELSLGHPDEAKARFEEAMKVFVTLGAAHSNSLVGVILGLGWAALALHDLQVARRMFLQVPPMSGCTAWEALDAAAGLAEVHVATGNASAAVALFARVLGAPATAYATRVRARQAVERLGPALPDLPDELAPRQDELRSEMGTANSGV